jgi:putative nucleotidyltransferase with HDIG domain
MSQILSRKIYRREDPVLYTAALLHDVGKIVLGEFVYASLEKIVDLVSKKGYTLLAAEKKVIGINHAELGGRIAEFWNFPPGLQEAIVRHHDPGKLSEEDIEEGKSVKATAALVYLSDQICVMIRLSGGSDSYSRDGMEEMLTAFHLQRKDLETAVVLLQDGLKQAQDLIDVVPE